MIVKINNILIDLPNNGYPYWTRINSGNGDQVSINNDELPIVIAALQRSLDRINYMIDNPTGAL